MTDCIPPTENQALGPRQSLYSSFSLALALRGGAIIRAPAKLRVIARWLSMDRRPSPDGADQIRENPSRRVPILLDPAQVAAATAALEFAIVHGRRSIESLTLRRADSSDSDSRGDDDESDHPNDRHHWYPLIQSLEVGDARLFFVSGSAGSVPGLFDAPQGDGLYRLQSIW